MKTFRERVLSDDEDTTLRFLKDNTGREVFTWMIPSFGSPRDDVLRALKQRGLVVSDGRRSNMSWWITDDGRKAIRDDAFWFGPTRRSRRCS